MAARRIDSLRPLKAIVVGAGISGILNAIKLQQAVRDLELVIFDKNADLGGTWFENRCVEIEDEEVVEADGLRSLIGTRVSPATYQLMCISFPGTPTQRGQRSTPLDLRYFSIGAE